MDDDRVTADVIIDLAALERPDALELTLVRAAYRDVLDVLAGTADFAAIDDFLK